MKLKCSRSPAGPWNNFSSFRSDSKEDKARYDVPMASLGVDNDLWFQVRPEPWNHTFRL